MRAGAAAGLLLALAASPAAAAADGTPGRPLAFERRNVFDPSVPGEDWWLFRFANRIHVMTRESVVEREVLPPLRERWDPSAAIQTERNLRALPFIRRAEVWESGIVRTQDSWTLQPQAGFGTEGGDRFILYGIRERNILGTGKSVSLFHTERPSEHRNELRYGDPRLGGTRERMTVQLADTSRGDEIGLHLNRPFFALDTAHANDLLFARINQEETLYQNAEETTRFDQDFRTLHAAGAVRLPSWDGFVQRLSLGARFERSRFAATSETAPGSLPPDRNLSGPVLGYSWVQARFLKEINIDRMQRVEDFNLGNELTLSGGPLLRSWGSDRDRFAFSAMDQQGLALGPGRFVLAQAGLEGRTAGGSPENVLFFANCNLFWKTGWPLPQTWVSHLEYNTSRRLDRERQLILGGDTGLRGYRNNSFTGGRSLLLNFEDRVFWDRDLLHVIYLGGVLFLDTGSMAGEGGDFRRLKTDIGAGLRISPSRSAAGGVLRLDVAYALDRGPGGARWVVTLLGGQAFSLTGSVNRKALRRPDAVIEEESAASRLLRR
ncbi:MAG TPA: hypothetical protein DD417_18250 [Elusimicrobia bacterium]|nr:hypothetical protein [Elusimicrobiota bacterium]